jgi:hypothetical protein
MSLISKLFGVTPTTYRRKKERVFEIAISGVNLVEYLVRKGLKVGNKVRLQVGVPEWVWLKPQYTKACLRGLIDTDGSFINHRYRVKRREYRYLKIAFENRSEPLLDFVYRGLEQLGFSPKREHHKVWLYSQSEAKRYLRDIGTRKL